MKKANRRVFTAIMLLFLSVFLFRQPTYALTTEAKESLKDMWSEASKWYDMFLAIVIPLFILRLAGCGLQILFSLGLTKGATQLDSIKKDVFFCILAVLVLCLLPTLISWAIDLFQGRAWDPYSIIILPVGGDLLC